MEVYGWFVERVGVVGDGLRSLKDFENWKIPFVNWEGPNLEKDGYNRGPLEPNMLSYTDKFNEKSSFSLQGEINPKTKEQPGRLSLRSV